MLNKLINKIRHLLCRFVCFIKSIRYRNTKNQFVKDLLLTCKKYGRRYDVFASILKKYSERLDSINKNLYMLLNEGDDKDTFLRFLLKAFYYINTATPSEIALIDDAYNKVRKLNKERKEDYIEFNFRGTDIKYLMHRAMREDETKPENILKNYYDVTHAFFLVEYEMEDFNPIDGETILDCGAAYGDTLLAFRVLYPNSKIYSFEFSDENVEIARKNMQLNQVKDAVINNAFLYKNSGKHIFNSATYKIDDNMSVVNGQEIETLALDDFIKENNIDNIGLIKFDIEGGEIPALKGAIKTIKVQKPLLYIPIYHLYTDIYIIPEFLKELNMPMKFRLKWTEKKVWGVDCVLFVKFL